MRKRRFAFFVAAAVAVSALVALTYEQKSMGRAEEVSPGHALPHEFAPACPNPCGAASLFQHMR